VAWPATPCARSSRAGRGPSAVFLIRSKVCVTHRMAWDRRQRPRSPWWCSSPASTIGEENRVVRDAPRIVVHEHSIVPPGARFRAPRAGQPAALLLRNTPPRDGVPRLPSVTPIPGRPCARHIAAARSISTVRVAIRAFGPNQLGGGLSFAHGERCLWYANESLSSRPNNAANSSFLSAPPTSPPASTPRNARRRAPAITV